MSKNGCKEGIEDGDRGGRTVLPLQNTTQQPSPGLVVQIQDLAVIPRLCGPLIGRVNKILDVNETINIVLTWWSECLC